MKTTIRLENPTKVSFNPTKVYTTITKVFQEATEVSFNPTKLPLPPLHFGPSSLESSPTLSCKIKFADLHDRKFYEETSTYFRELFVTKGKKKSRKEDNSTTNSK